MKGIRCMGFLFNQVDSCMHICKFISWVTASTRYQSGASWVIDCTPVGSNTGKPLEKAH